MGKKGVPLSSKVLLCPRAPNFYVIVHVYLRGSSYQRVRSLVMYLVVIAMAGSSEGWVPAFAQQQRTSIRTVTRARSDEVELLNKQDLSVYVPIEDGTV